MLPSYVRSEVQKKALVDGNALSLISYLCWSNNSYSDERLEGMSALKRLSRNDAAVVTWVVSSGALAKFFQLVKSTETRRN